MTVYLNVISERDFFFIGTPKIINANLNFLIFNQNSIFTKTKFIKPTSKPFQISALILLQNKVSKNLLIYLVYHFILNILFQSNLIRYSKGS